MPAIGYEAHDKLELIDSSDCLTLNAGCTSFVDGIGLIYDLMGSRKYRNALLLNGDVLSKYIDITDFSTASVFGDAGSATLVTNNSHKSKYILVNKKLPKSSRKLYLGLNNESNSSKIYKDLCFNWSILKVSSGKETDSK